MVQCLVVDRHIYPDHSYYPGPLTTGLYLQRGGSVSSDRVTTPSYDSCLNKKAIPKQSHKLWTSPQVLGGHQRGNQRKTRMPASSRGKHILAWRELQWWTDIHQEICIWVAKDVIALNVSGTMMVTTRSTLCTIQDSVLSQQSNSSKWTEQGCDGLPVCEWTSDLGQKCWRTFKGGQQHVAREYNH